MDKREVRGCSGTDMRKMIGIVGEGPTDYMVIKEVIEKIRQMLGVERPEFSDKEYRD